MKALRKMSDEQLIQARRQATAKWWAADRGSYAEQEWLDIDSKLHAEQLRREFAAERARESNYEEEQG